MEVVQSAYAGGHLIETKEHTVDGVHIGIIEGYIAAWAPDEGGMFGMPDRFHRGAFLKSIEEHKKRNNRQVRFKDHHGRTVGGFPIETVREDDIGLFGSGQINLEVQQGREAYSLAKQRVLVDFSVGFVSVEDKINANIRDIFEAKLFEGSIIDEPMNRAANVTEVKGVTKFLEALKRSCDASGETLPFEIDEKNPVITTEIFEYVSTREFEQLLVSSGMFSKKVATAIASRAKTPEVEGQTMGDVLAAIENINV